MTRGGICLKSSMTQIILNFILWPSNVQFVCLFFWPLVVLLLLMYLYHIRHTRTYAHTGALTQEPTLVFRRLNSYFGILSSYKCAVPSPGLVSTHHDSEEVQYPWWQRSKICPPPQSLKSVTPPTHRNRKTPFLGHCNLKPVILNHVPSPSTKRRTPSKT